MRGFGIETVLLNCEGGEERIADLDMGLERLDLALVGGGR